MNNARVREIKHAQKESFYTKELSKFFRQIVLDDKSLEGLWLTRVKLSSDNGLCTLMFYTPEGEAHYKEKLSRLVLYKPSLRNSLSKAWHSKYTPDLIFKYDAQFEKSMRVQQLIDQLKDDGSL